ncbi:hypothetical protein MYSTI_07874 [Myxococcus stipitatus DSM 14675]|uniref:Cytochrome c domain-containing protein n=1 Tax=Myxococcus stipitatus (strain DSM 14675 / JCM 12634 / Mx s8) TaxID=1278073 RepID=L7UJH5_MYXSD|nr:hypothetical protein [Myxococcus stipitatus]AGC49146.1 hypothetical protein MYSTI_07874 [Myxococcus stipitatus DSM 14675]
MTPLRLSGIQKSLLVVLALVAFGPALAAPPSFLTFESGQVRPLAMSPDGSRLFAVNTPDNSVSVFKVEDSGLTLQAKVTVGLEPVAVAPRGNDEVWVVNHLSDSVSVVSLTGTPRVVRTLLVGDEPRDIVFAGPKGRAFITTAHRGQHRTHASLAGVPGAGDPQLTTPGVGRADVWVFDPASLGTTLGGTPVRILNLFGDTPRALTVSPDGRTVYAAVFKSGNQTTAVLEELVCEGFNPYLPCLVSGGIYPGGSPGPETNHQGVPAPEVALIVKYDRQFSQWRDELGRNWNNAIRFNLPDQDVFAIDADGLTQKEAFAHVGTTLFNMVTNPVTGTVYVSNTEANNHVRFEGPGVFGGTTVQGHLAETRITAILAGTVMPRHLNKHLDYAKLASEPGFDPTAKAHSLATPLDMVVSRDGRTLYVAAYGSSKVGVFDTQALESDSFDPRLNSGAYIPVSGGGPSGLVLDEARGRLYVMTRFDNAVKVLDLATRTEVGQQVLFNPEPVSVVQGRPVLYDAATFSANGEASCSSCHIFGDMDDLAWDLGNPDDDVTQNPISGRLLATATLLKPHINGSGKVSDFHPMKGPMTTQTMRGMSTSGPMHWRGDRANGFFGVSGSDPNLSFMNFIVAFEGLLGRASKPTLTEMQRFTDFQLQVVLPPNPVRNLDNSLTAAQQRGLNFYAGSRRSDGLPLGEGLGFTCEGCHRLDPSKGFYGTDGQVSFENIPQIVKIPHLRNLYQKVGMFGNANTPFFMAPDSGWMGNQVRGFGMVHDGAVDTIARFLSAIVFIPSIGVGFPLSNPDGTRRDVEQLMLAFDTDLAPIVGQQVTLSSTNAASVGPRIDLLLQRARTPFTSKILGGVVKECELVAKVALGGRVKGFLYNPTGNAFIPDDGTTTTVSDATLRGYAKTVGQEITYTCVPPGSGARIGLNR